MKLEVKECIQYYDSFVLALYSICLQRYDNYGDKVLTFNVKAALFFSNESE